MARSSLLGIEPSPTEPEGRDKAALGPSDSSDSGSDVTGLHGDDDDVDPGLPVDVALRDDQGAPLSLGESLPAGEGGTGVRDGADIGVDEVFSLDARDGLDDGAAVLADRVADVDAAAGDGDDNEDAGDEPDAEPPAGRRAIEPGRR